MSKRKKCGRCGKVWSAADCDRVVKATENRMRNGALVLFFAVIPASLMAIIAWDWGLASGLASLGLALLSFVWFVRAINRPLHILPKVELPGREAGHKRSWAGIRAQMGSFPLALKILLGLTAAFSFGWGSTNDDLSTFETILYPLLLAGFIALAYTVFTVAVLFFKSLPKREPCLGCRMIFGMRGFGWAGTALPPPGSAVSLADKDWTSTANESWTAPPPELAEELERSAPSIRGGGVSSKDVSVKKEKNSWAVPLVSSAIANWRLSFKIAIIIFAVAFLITSVLLLID